MIIHFHGKIHLEPKYEKRNPNIQRIFHFVDRTRSRKREREQKFETRERERRESSPLPPLRNSDFILTVNLR